jgi:trans-aconitate 2-methyltransferase
VDNYYVVKTCGSDEISAAGTHWTTGPTAGHADPCVSLGKTRVSDIEKEKVMPREWDATGYDRQPLPHLHWGRRTVERLAPQPGETVLDAGCGTGRDAETLLRTTRVARVIAVDGSKAMLDRLRERLAADLAAGRVEAVQADLGEPLPIGEPVDAVISVAAFHWVPDHAALFTHLAAVMRPGARLATDCGGLGNIASVAAAVEQVLGPQPSPWNFAGVAETEARLVAAGLEPQVVRLVEHPAVLDDDEQLRDYLRTVVLGGQLDRIPPAQHDDVVADVAACLGEPVVDYVRLEISATRI